MTKFYKYGDRDRKQQTFDKEKITITKAGKTYNVFDAIQAANIDTDIYEVIKKYHINESEAVNLMLERGGEQGVYGDIVALQEKIKDIGDVQQIAQQAKEMFEQLPAEIKTKYGNDLEQFLIEQKKKQSEPVEQPKQEVTDNETK